MTLHLHCNVRVARHWLVPAWNLTMMVVVVEGRGRNAHHSLYVTIWNLVCCGARPVRVRVTGTFLWPVLPLPHWNVEGCRTATVECGTHTHITKMHGVPHQTPVSEPTDSSPTCLLTCSTLLYDDVRRYQPVGVLAGTVKSLTQSLALERPEEYLRRCSEYLWSSSSYNHSPIVSSVWKRRIYAIEQQQQQQQQRKQQLKRNEKTFKHTFRQWQCAASHHYCHSSIELHRNRRNKSDWKRSIKLERSNFGAGFIVV